MYMSYTFKLDTYASLKYRTFYYGGHKSADLHLLTLVELVYTIKGPAGVAIEGEDMSYYH